MKVSHLLVLSLITALSNISFTQYNIWKYKTPMPTAGTFLSSTILDNKLYVIGGCPTTNATNKVEVYDPSSNTWSDIANLPAPRCYAVSCAYQNKIYVFGGTDNMWTGGESSVYMYDLQRGNWTQKTDMPFTIGGSGSAVVGDTIYMIGGAPTATSLPQNKVWAYDPATETWTQKADLPTARNMISSCVVDGKIYAIGGTTEDWENVFYKVMEVYDPATNTWEQKADMPTGRWGFVTCVIDGLIYTIGGRAGPSSSAMNEVYDPVTNTWITKAPMHQSRTGLAGGTVNNKIYVAGGHQGPPMVFLSSCEEYTPDLSDLKSDSYLLPEKIELFHNYPNPFNPSTVISYQLPVSIDLVLKVFDVLGNEIATLVDEYKPAGKYEVEFQSALGSRHLASGVYFYKIQAGGFVETKKMILFK